MKIFSIAAVSLAFASIGVTSATASTSLFATAEAAQKVCGSDEIVWVDLDKGRFFHKPQANFGKGGNGGYACLKAAHSQYREAHD